MGSNRKDDALLDLHLLSLRLHQPSFPNHSKQMSTKLYKIKLEEVTVSIHTFSCFFQAFPNPLRHTQTNLRKDLWMSMLLAWMSLHTMLPSASVLEIASGTKRRNASTIFAKRHLAIDLVSFVHTCLCLRYVFYLWLDWKTFLRCLHIFLFLQWSICFGLLKQKPEKKDLEKRQLTDGTAMRRLEGNDITQTALLNATRRNDVSGSRLSAWRRKDPPRPPKECFLGRGFM